MNRSNIYKENNTVTARYEILRDGGVWDTMHSESPATIQNISSSELKMSLTGTFYVPKKSVNWLKDRIRAVLTVNGVDYNKGVFIVTTVESSGSAEGETIDIEAYSPLYLAQRSKLEGIYTIPKGTNYIAAVQTLLLESGITEYTAEETDLVMATDRQDWEEGTPRLEVINELLAEINYNSAWPDLNGKIHITKYKPASNENIKHTYKSGQYSVLTPEYKESTDLFGKPNVFKCVCENPDLAEPLVAVAVNEDPNSKFSTVSLGARVLYLESVGNVPDLATLQERADNLRMKSLQTTQEIEFTTALMPGHETNDTVALENGKITGVYAETEWRATMDASGLMVHKGKRVIE
jgi:hypothetical protein